jgi:pimeloyl-ACP methyl ester carboxylesterase
MYYEVHGEGAPLVLINGYSRSSEGWDASKPIVESLSKHSKVIAQDNRGTGRNSKPEGPYSIKTMADDIARAIVSGIHV